MNIAYVIRKNVSAITKPTRHSPVIEISFGQLQGRISTSRDGRKYFQYLGIPYAAPPIRDLRFEPPQPWTESWPGVRDATKHGAKAVQFDALTKKVVGDEDCLFVDVYTPQIGHDNKFPVLVWIHGGSFILGSGNDYKPDYFMEYDCVVVAFNYRLGCFGFMDTGDGVVRGNMGLKDQTMALRWVQDNISAFGGDPANVTIAGESAGGASVHFHVLSPRSKGLFHKAISQSGLATLPFSIHPKPANLATRFAEILRAPTEDTREMVHCLKTLEATTLASVQLGMFDNFRPTIEIDFGDDSAIITQNPQNIIDSGNFNKVPYLVGLNSGEGILLATPALTNKTTAPELGTDWGKKLAPFLFFPPELDPTILNLSEHLYLGPDGYDYDPANPLKHMQAMANLFSDRIWNLGFHNAITGHLKALREEVELDNDNNNTNNNDNKNPLFIYYYDYYGQYSLGDLVLAIGGDYHPLVELIKIKGSKWFKEKIKRENIPKYGSCHGDGLSMQWYMPAMCYVPPKSPDYEMSKEIVKSMVQFIQLKKPQLSFFGQEWLPQPPEDQQLQYMHISPTPKMILEPFTQRLEFWKALEL